MDFTLTDEQLAVSEAAGGVFSGLVDAERIAAVEASTERIDRDLWRALAAADLLGLAVPEADGGAGYGLMELCLLLEAQGNAVAPVPLWSTLVLGALPFARFGSEAQRAPLAARRGRRRRDPDRGADRQRASSPTSMPSVRASAVGRRLGVWTGPSWPCPRRHLADRIVLPARTEDGGVLLALLDPAAPGVTLERAVTTNREIHPHLHLDGVHAGGRTTSWSARTPGRAALDFALMAADHRALRAAGRRVRGGAHQDGGLPEHPPAVRPAAQHVPGHHAAGRRRRHRHRGDARHVAERGVALRHRPRGRRRGPGGQVAGLRTRDSGRCTPPSTCTAAWGRTSRTRSTATSSGASRSSCCWVARARSWRSWAPDIAAQALARAEAGS